MNDEIKDLRERVEKLERMVDLHHKFIETASGIINLVADFARMLKKTFGERDANTFRIKRSD